MYIILSYERMNEWMKILSNSLRVLMDIFVQTEWTLNCTRPIRPTHICKRKWSYEKDYIIFALFEPSSVPSNFRDFAQNFKEIERNGLRAHQSRTRSFFYTFFEFSFQNIAQNWRLRFTNVPFWKYGLVYCTLGKCIWHVSFFISNSIASNFIGK